MRISTWCAAVCAMAVGAVVAVRAADNPAQAAARAALMKALGEPPAPAQPTRPTQPAQPTAQPPPAATRTAPPAAVSAQPNTLGDNPAQAAARAALMKELAQLNVQPSATNSGVPPVVVAPSGAAPATSATPAPTAPRARGDSWFTPVPPPSGTYTITPRAVAPTATSQPPAQPPTAPAVSRPAPPPVVAPTVTPTAANWPGKDLGFKPIEAPPPPVTPEQEAQLHALLQQYEANQITPEQYQAGRAKILGER